MKRIYSITILLVFTVCINAQSRIAKGIILDKDGYEVIYATIIEKAKPQNGTMTDIDGKFSLQLTDSVKNEIEVSFIGFKSQVIEIRNSYDLKIILEDNSDNLTDDCICTTRTNALLEGGGPFTPVGIGAEGLFKFIPYKPYRGFDVDAMFKTDYGNNQIWSARLYTPNIGKVGTRYMFDRYYIPERDLNFNKHTIRATPNLFSSYQHSNKIEVEYLERRRIGEKDEYSIILSESYSPRFPRNNVYTLYTIRGQVGVSMRGTVQAEFGLDGAIIQNRLYTSVSAGTWMDKFKFNAEGSYRLKPKVNIKAGYERFMNYNNTYIGVQITIKTVSGMCSCN